MRTEVLAAIAGRTDSVSSRRGRTSGGEIAPAFCAVSDEFGRVFKCPTERVSIGTDELLFAQGHGQYVDRSRGLLEPNHHSPAARKGRLDGGVKARFAAARFIDDASRRKVGRVGCTGRAELLRDQEFFGVDVNNSDGVPVREKCVDEERSYSTGSNDDDGSVGPSAPHRVHGDRHGLSQRNGCVSEAV